MLGDFDLSVDLRTRVSCAYTHKAGSFGYVAPEIVRRGGNASFASDMYSFGSTVRAVAAPSPDMDAFTDLLMAERPEGRPTAVQAASHAFFTPTRAWKREQDTQICGLVVACDGESIPVSSGVMCPDGHFCCNECLEQHMIAACADELQYRRIREGKVQCWKACRNLKGGECAQCYEVHPPRPGLL